MFTILDGGIWALFIMAPCHYMLAAMSDTPTRDQNKFIVRMPEGMRERLRREAEISGRSMNTEIIVRLEQSLDGAFVDMSTIGFIAMIKRLEATTHTLEALLMGQLEGLRAQLVLMQPSTTPDQKDQE